MYQYNIQVSYFQDMFVSVLFDMQIGSEGGFLISNLLSGILMIHIYPQLSQAGYQLDRKFTNDKIC